MIDAEQDIIDRAGKAIAAEMDFTVLSEMLCGIGWTKVILKPMTWEDGANIDAWVAKHIKGHHQTMGLVWVFEREQDATWFILKWSS